MVCFEDLTLVIPTFERQQLVLLAMSYWNELGVELHVIDGSEKPIPTEALPQSQKIHYYHMPAPLFDRLSFATEIVQTPFCGLISDDEFFLPTGLRACLTELSNDPELVACIGRALAFDATSDRVEGVPAYPEMAGRRIDQKTAAERVRAHLGDYRPSTIYAVTRTDVWKKALRASVAKSFPVFALPELRFEAAIAYQGPSRVIPVLSWLRNVGEPPKRGQDETLDVRNTFHEWWNDENKFDQRCEFLSLMAEHLRTDAASDEERQIVHDLEQAFTHYDNTIQERKTAWQTRNSAARSDRVVKKKQNLLQRFQKLIFGAGDKTPQSTHSTKGRQKPIMEKSSSNQKSNAPRRKDIFLAVEDLRAEGVLVNLNEIEKVVQLMGFMADRSTFSTRDDGSQNHPRQTS